MFLHTFSVVLPDPEDPNIVSWHLKHVVEGSQDKLLIGDVTNRILILDLMTATSESPPLTFQVQWSDRDGMLRPSMRFSMDRRGYTRTSSGLEKTIVRRTKVRALP